jgi:hypothetical protein
MRAIKHSSDDRIPEPSRHRVKNVPYQLNQMRDVVIMRAGGCIIFSAIVHSKSIKALLALELVKEEAK